MAAVSANRAHVIRRDYTIRARICKGEEEKFSESSHFVWERFRNNLAILQILVCRTVLSLYFSVYSDRKVPKEHRQRAGRPLDTRFPYMGLFDRGYTRRGIRKALRKSLRRRFSHAPPNLTQSRCAAMVAVAGSLPRRARPAIRQTHYLPAEKKGVLRADGAPPFVRVIGPWRLCAQSDSFAPPWAEESRRPGGGFLKGGTVGDSLEWRSFGTFLPSGAEKYISLTHR